MGLLEAISSEMRQRSSTQCSVGALIDQVDKADRAVLIDALTGRDEKGQFKVPHAALARALKKIGFQVAPQTIGRHRTGTCMCEQS